MENSRPCKKCKKRALVTDNVTGNLVCSSCGVIQDFDNFEHHFGGLTGPTGTFVRTGTSGTSSDFNYRDRKIYKAVQTLEHITTLLNFSDSRTKEVKSMVEAVTEGEYGAGSWLPVLIGACSYVVMRRDNRSLPLVEVADKVGCDVYELGRMVGKVINFLELKLPEFDMVNSFERSVQTCFGTTIGKEKIGTMIKQGIFLVQCLVKWYVTTGRRPLPVVVAVLVFVAQLNEVDVEIERVSNELCVAVRTSRLRYAELLERLVEVAQAALPWGNDITVKNILKNAPFVIQYMELKSMTKHSEKSSSVPALFDLDDLVGDCLSKEFEYGMNSAEVEKDSQYFELDGEKGFQNLNDELENVKLSHECLSLLYSQFLDNVASVAKSARESKKKANRRTIRLRTNLSDCREWWEGKSELSKKLILKKILEKDVGLNAMPPSFVSGCLENTRRRKKIKAAKLRIARVMCPPDAKLDHEDDLHLDKCTIVGKKRRRKRKEDADWEDFIIETLLLHQVKEEEIEKGHYNTLLDLHVFNSGSE